MCRSVVSSCRVAAPSELQYNTIHATQRSVSMVLFDLGLYIGTEYTPAYYMKQRFEIVN